MLRFRKREAFTEFDSTIGVGSWMGTQSELLPTYYVSDQDRMRNNSEAAEGRMIMSSGNNDRNNYLVL